VGLARSRRPPGSRGRSASGPCPGPCGSCPARCRGSAGLLHQREEPLVRLAEGRRHARRRSIGSTPGSAIEAACPSGPPPYDPRMLGMGIGELLVVLVIVLVVFGAGRLPEVMGSIGQGSRPSRRACASRRRSTSPQGLRGCEGEEERERPSPAGSAPARATTSAPNSVQVGRRRGEHTRKAACSPGASDQSFRRPRGSGGVRSRAARAP